MTQAQALLVTPLLRLHLGEQPQRLFQIGYGFREREGRLRFIGSSSRIPVALGRVPPLHKVSRQIVHERFRVITAPFL